MPAGYSEPTKEDAMDLLSLLGLVAIWYIVNRWVLPRLGVQT
jgi:hypothetical protein